MPHADRKWIEEVFQHLLDLPPDQRDRYLDSSCGNDATLRNEVDKLLRIYDEGIVDAVRTPVLFAEDVPSFAEELPTQIGRYKILQKIGEGGLGVVYEARQDNPNRLVALKIMRAGLLSEQLVRRFQREAHVLGQLQHPGIAQIHDAGIAANTQQSYLAMELVRGRPLNEHAAANRFNTREKLEVMAKICDAVQHAHDRGVIHRDLKPANILVDETGHPKVLDFGVARATGSDLHTVTLKTNVGQLIGTIPYMSPEQVSGDVGQLDARSDVYALGVVMYELLSGRLPIDVHGRSIPEAVRLIREQDPTRLGSLDTSLRGEIDTIVAKATEKDKTRRYQSAAELAADIRRYLRDEPIVARPTSTFYQLRKFAKRNRALVVGVGATMLVLAVLAVRESLARRDAQLIAYRAGMAAAAAALRGYNCSEAKRRLEQVPAGLRGWEWFHLHSQLDDSIASFQTGDAIPLRFDQDNNVVHALSTFADSRPGIRPVKRHEILELDLSSHRVTGLRSFEALSEVIFGRFPERISYVGPDLVCYAEDLLTGGDRIALGTVAYDSQDGGINPVPGAATGDSRGVLWFDEGKVDESDLQTGERRSFGGRIPGPHRALALNHDSSLIAFPVGNLGKPEIWVSDTRSGRLQHQWRGHTNTIWETEFSPDGSRLISASLDHTIRQWPLDETKEPQWNVISEHADRVLSLAHRPDSVQFATVSRDRTVRIWDTQSAEALGVYLGHEDEIHCVIYSSDGRRLATASQDGTIRVWDAPQRGHPRILRGHTSFVYAVALSPDGSRIVSGGWDDAIRIWDAESGEQVATWAAEPNGAFPFVESLAFAPNGEHIAVCSRTGDWPPRFRIRVLDTATGAQVSMFEDSGFPGRIAFHPDGSRIAVCGGAHPRLILLDRKTLQEVASAPGQSFSCFSPDGTWIATEGLRAQGENTIVVYKADLHRREATLVVPQKVGIHNACFSPDGRRIAIAGTDHAVRVWDWASGKKAAVFRGHTDKVYSVAFSPDGTRIVSGSNDRTIRIWDAQNSEEIVQLTGHKDYVYSLAFSPDGQRLVSGSGDFTVRIWETQPLRARIQAQRERQALCPEMER